MGPDAPTGLKRILVFRIGHLGDTVVALPAFWALRDAFPGAKLALLSNSDPKDPRYVSARSVLPEEDLFDQWLSYPAYSDRISSIATKIRLLFEIRRGKFDAVFYLMTRNRTPSQIDRDIRFFRLAGIGRILGIDHLRENLLSSPIPIPTPEITPESEYLTENVRSEGIQIGDSARYDLALAKEERERTSRWLAGISAGADRPIVAVAPGSKWSSKVWPEERFQIVVARLVRDFGIFPVVLGGPEDRPIGKRLIHKWKTGAIAAGELSVRESAALLEHCVLYVGNDTGTMHLAGAVGTPCVAVFAAVDWIGKWKPFGERNRLFRAHVECEGCHSPTCPYENKCLSLIAIDEVYDACSDILRESVATVAAFSQC
jgi:ADP-heptose:LPS heptosyltransferase